MALVWVKAADGLRVGQVAICEDHDDHPGGQAFVVAGEGAKQVALTALVGRKLAVEELVKAEAPEPVDDDAADDAADDHEDADVDSSDSPDADSGDPAEGSADADDNGADPDSAGGGDEESDDDAADDADTEAEHTAPRRARKRG